MKGLRRPKSFGWEVFFVLVLMGVGFFYRLKGLKSNYSFWSDEAHVAVFVRAILVGGRPILTNGFSTGVYQGLWYWLSAFSAQFLGLNEFAIRLPAVLFGVATIFGVYLLGKELFGPKISLVAAFLITFLKIEILWSRQARPYQALQFFSLLSAYFLWRVVHSQKRQDRFWYGLGLFASGFLASLMHGLGLVIVFNSLFFLGLSLLGKRQRSYWLLGVGGGGFLFLVFVFRDSLMAVVPRLGRVNNLFYYRIFLTHHYWPLVVLAGLGSWFWWQERRRLALSLLFLFLINQGLVVSFLLPQPFTRYLYPVFPFIILLASVGLLGVINRFCHSRVIILSFCLGALALLSQDKFIWWPQPFYSLNEEMQEIPEVDYRRLYQFVAAKKRAYPEAVFIANWNDHAIWYLGEGQLDCLLRPGGGRKRDPLSGAIYLKDLVAFQRLMAERWQGLVLLESWDNRVPEKVRDYIRVNLKKEFELDRLYPVQPRLWPVEIYSWGLDN